MWFKHLSRFFPDTYILSGPMNNILDRISTCLNWMPKANETPGGGFSEPLRVGAATLHDHAATAGQVALSSFTTGVDSGTANNCVVTVPTQIIAYTEGLEIKFKPKFQPTGAMQINLNGLGNVPLKNVKGEDINALDIETDTYLYAKYNGSEFRVLSMLAGDLTRIRNLEAAAAMSPVATAINVDTVFHVSPSGSSANDGSAGHPWKYLTDAMDYLKNKWINPGVRVDIIMYSGHVSYNGHKVDLYHPCGKSIFIGPAGAARASLSFDSGAGPVLTLNGGELGSLRGLEVTYGLASGTAVHLIGGTIYNIDIKVNSNEFGIMMESKSFIKGQIFIGGSDWPLHMRGGSQVFAEGNMRLSCSPPTGGMCAYLSGDSVLSCKDGARFDNGLYGIYATHGSKVLLDNAPLFYGCATDTNIAMSSGDAAPIFGAGGSYIHHW